ncbi:MAG: flagellar biosynthetic protein FliO [Myxococcales bacterium]|nr:flagellar biosynthetic protein FliO [Myxococcales bacterium]
MMRLAGVLAALSMLLAGRAWAAPPSASAEVAPPATKAAVAKQKKKAGLPAAASASPEDDSALATPPDAPTQVAAPGVDAGTGSAERPPVVPPPDDEATPHPLELRKQTPLALAPSAATDGLWWKATLLAIAGGAAFWVYKRRGKAMAGKEVEKLRIVGRASIGVRSELVMIEADGQRILLAVTPGKVRRLARFETDGAPALGAAEPFAASLRVVERRLQSTDEAGASDPSATPPRLLRDGARDGQADELRRLAKRRPS